MSHLTHFLKIITKQEPATNLISGSLLFCIRVIQNSKVLH